MATEQLTAARVKVHVKNQKAWQVMLAGLADFKTPKAKQVFIDGGIPLPGGVEVTQMAAMGQALINRVLDPDSKDAVAAFAVIRDTAGGKPVDKIVTEEAPGSRVSLKDILALQSVRKALIEESSQGNVQRLEEEKAEDTVEMELSEDGKSFNVPQPKT